MKKPIRQTPSIKFLAIGFYIALALIVGFYSRLGALICLACAYGAVRWIGGGFWIQGNSDEVPSGRRMEVLTESDEELVVRGNERVLILNRKRATISGIHSTITTFEKVRNVRIEHIRDHDSGRDSYSVCLALGTFSSVCLGSSDSQFEASTIAAKLGRWTGKDVVALR